MTQTEWILDALQRGPITPIDALNGCGCFRLGARIHDLRQQGHVITTENYHTPSGKVVARYRLVKPGQQTLNLEEPCHH
jgi:hypothetical protein